MVRGPIPASFSTLPFDKIDSVESVWMHDDFILGEDVADFTGASGVAVVSELAWRGSEVAGDSTANAVFVAGVADHPGIIQLQTGATTPADGDIAALSLGALPANDADGPIVLDGNGVYMAAILRIPDVDAQKVEFGLIGQAPAAVNSSVADFVGFVWDPEDAANVADELFLVQVNGAGSDTEKVLDKVAYVQNDWVLLEMAADDTSATFRITTEDNTQTVTIDGSDSVTIPTVALRPNFAVEAVGAAEEVLDIDAFHMRILRRSVPFKSTGYLGA